MKQTVNLSDFRTAFFNMGRKDQFSYEALDSLFTWLEECEQDMGEEIELDVIALCCDYAEMNADDVILCYSLEDDVDGLNDDERAAHVRDYLNDKTILCGETSAGTFVFANF